jgi:predicted Rossmann fold nucleotide-binding protein DprA/Smf involved in DNA uptake
MILGFTGTRRGCSVIQVGALRAFLRLYQPGVLLHGGAIGADNEAHHRAIELGWRVNVYPADGDATWYNAIGGEFPWGIVYSTQPPLVRNRIIAERCERLVVCPGEATEKLRSGTWMTVRAARKLGRPVTLVLPDGSIKEERPR